MMRKISLYIRYIFCLAIVFVGFTGLAQTSMGSIIDNTNEALPSSYNFKEYVFAEPDDQGICNGATNSTAELEEVFFAQTHRHSTDHPFFFTIGQRPMLIQVAVTGSGEAPDVQVEGFKDGSSIGLLCLKGPSTLQENIDLQTPNFEDYFSVTIPKSWVDTELSLKVMAGATERTIPSEELKVGPYTQLNLVMFNMDVLDYNTGAHNTPEIENFLQELASAIPASVVRFGTFPETLEFPEIIANNDTEQLVRLAGRSAMAPNGIFSDGSINSIATLFLTNLHRSTNDYHSTVYFGNTLNLAPGGWGGGKSFVSFDYDDVFIHELGHALSLPHWGESAYDIEDPNEYQFLYPYGGANDDGGGRGESWNFIQDIYEFIDPVCQFDERGTAGLETSDAMQRNNHCLGDRSESQGPWDGFGDFSAFAIHKYLVGNEVEAGSVSYKGQEKDFQFRMNDGFGSVSLENGKRLYNRAPSQSQEVPFDQQFELPGEEQLNVPAYLIYGTAHETQEQANIVYKPIKFTGTLPPILDLTNPATFAELQQEKYIPYLATPRDITFRLTYEDGSILHVTNPYHSYVRAPYDWGFHIWRNDLCNYSIVVPGDKELMKVELFKRPFVLRNDGDPLIGNINDASQGITAENFMDDAVFQAEYVFGQAQILGSNTIGNRVWHDLNQNGLDDFDEPGIEGVKLLLWTDSNGDNIPDSEGFGGVATTDENGYYSFGGLGPGKYIVFVWSVDNWEEGGPLHNMVSSEGAVDPNTDINNDDNGSPGGFAGLGNLDIASGIIEITADGEPLNDGDREDDWFDFDPSGNMTIDFGFHFETECVEINSNLAGEFMLCEGQTTEITATALNGEAPHSFLWSTGEITSSISNLSPGSYSVTTTDNLGCTGVNNFEILEQEEIVVTFTGTDSICTAGTGVLDLLVTGGEPPYSIEFGSGGFPQTGLDTGEYKFTVMDNNGCATDASFEIFQGSESTCMTSTECVEITSNLAGELAICDGQSTEITATAVNGEAPFSFVWSTGETTSNISIMDPGSYAVTTTDNMGCTGVSNFEIVASAEIVVAITGTDSICSPGTGSLNFDISGGNPPYAIAFLDDGGLTELDTGLYEFIVTDDSGCDKAASFEIFQGSEIGCTTSTDDLLSQSISIYPNPFGDFLIIEKDIQHNYSFELLDITGHRILYHKLADNKDRIGIGNIPQGIYFGVVRDENNEILKYQKLVRM